MRLITTRFAPMLVLLVAAGCASTVPSGGGSFAFDGVDYTPKRAIEANESYTFTASSHGAAVRTDWQVNAGVLSLDSGPTTVWRAVKPGGQLSPGRVRLEVRMVSLGSAAGTQQGGTFFLTIGAQGRASVDSFSPGVYADSPGATPTPALESLAPSSPLPSGDPSPLDATPTPSASLDPGATQTAATSGAAATAAASPGPSPSATAGAVAPTPRATPASAAPVI
jgi:hypothetical protein